MITVKVLYQDITKVKTDLMVVTFFKDIIPLKGYAGDTDWLLNGHISSLIKSEKAFGTYNETILLNSQKKISASKVLIFGLGQSTSLRPSKIFQAYANLARTIIKINVTDFCFGVFVRELPTISYKNIAENIIGGILSELSVAAGQNDFYLKVVEGNEQKISLLRKTVKQSLGKYKKKKCKIELDNFIC